MGLLTCSGYCLFGPGGDYYLGGRDLRMLFVRVRVCAVAVVVIGVVSGCAGEGSLPTLVEPLGSDETVEDLFYRTVVGASDSPFFSGRTEGLASIGRGICDVLDSNESTETYTDEGVVGMLGFNMREAVGDNLDDRGSMVLLVYSTVAFCPDHLHQNSVIRRLAEGLASES